MCSAPWYSNTRLRSFTRESRSRYPRKIAVRSTPSTAQNATEEPSWCLIRLVTPTGTTKNSPIANTAATATVPIQAPPDISCSSPGSWALAEMPSARMPIASDSTSATTPRITGQR